MPNGDADQGEPCLIAYARSLQCALPLGQVLEIMRPLPIDPISRAPSFVLGVAIVRGEPTPVIDCGAFMQVSAPAQHTRWASVRAGQGTAVLAFESIRGVRALPTQLHALPPLLCGAPSEQIARLASLDAALLLVLHESRLVPEEVLRLLDGDAA
jgi:purine-binding chemotaxis protein CheW